MEIVKSSNSDSKKIQIGTQISGLLERQSRLSSQEKETLLDESVDILSKCTSIDNDENFDTGLIFGYVQSGKTLSFTSVIALARDNSFRIVIILAGTKNNLLTQTTDRIKSDLLVDGDNIRHFKILQNPTSEKHSIILKSLLSQSKQPLVVITLLKHGGRIDKVSDLIANVDIQAKLGNQPVLIIDDEADQASLNILARRNARNGENEESRTFESINNLREQIINHTFLQYTATPQGPLLIDIMNTLSPNFHKVLTPGTSYTGGQAFFNSEISPRIIVTIPDEEVYHHSRNPLDSPPESLIRCLEDFLIGSAIVIELKESLTLLSMMIHPATRKESNRIFKAWIDNIIERWILNFELPEGDLTKIEFINNLNIRVKEFLKECQMQSISTTDVIDAIKERLLDTMTHLVIGGELEVDWSLSSGHILIGGAKLDRGYTVKGLVTTYMPRMSFGPSNADTIQQRCRFFGYKKDILPYCRVYLPLDSINDYEIYVEHEWHLRNVLSECKTTEEFSKQFILGGGLRPTRLAILEDDLVRSSLSGAKQLNAIKDYKQNTLLVNSLLNTNKAELYKDENIIERTTKDRTHRFCHVPISSILEFLYQFKVTSADDIELKALTIEYLLYHRDRNKVTSCNLVEMAFGRSEPRVRSLKTNNTISNIFSGPSPSGSNIYEGDRLIRNEDMLTIQIHNIILDATEFAAYDSRVIYTLGFVYPKNLNLTFIGS